LAEGLRVRVDDEVAGVSGVGGCSRRALRKCRGLFAATGTGIQD
jgi:hypothetical protein